MGIISGINPTTTAIIINVTKYFFIFLLFPIVNFLLQNKLLLNNYNVNLPAIAMPVQGLKYDRFYFLSKINF
jgi:hypothetical protein